MGGDAKRIATVSTYLNRFGGLSSGVNGKKSSCLVMMTETKSVETLLHSIRICGLLVYKDDKCTCLDIVERYV